MRTVTAHLIFSRIFDNATGECYYIVRNFYAVKRDGMIVSLISYGDNVRLAYKYESMQDLLKDMKSILKNNGFYSKSVIIGDTIFDGIICSEINYETVISSPTLFARMR